MFSFVIVCVLLCVVFFRWLLVICCRFDLFVSVVLDLFVCLCGYVAS